MFEAVMDQVAYIARYGHQPLSEIWPLTPVEADHLQRALARIVEKENKSGGG